MSKNSTPPATPKTSGSPQSDAANLASTGHGDNAAGGQKVQQAKEATQNDPAKVDASKSEGDVGEQAKEAGKPGQTPSSSSVTGNPATSQGAASEQQRTSPAADAKPGSSAATGRPHDPQEFNSDRRKADRLRDEEMNRRRGDRPQSNRPDAPDAVRAQHEQRERDKAKLDEENAEGHEKNMQAIEQAAEQAAEPVNFTPTGKEDNRNTPIVMKDGTKKWL